jgi:hypothetical protein
MAWVNVVSFFFFQFWTSIFSFWTVLPHPCLSFVSLDGSPLLFLCFLPSCHSGSPSMAATAPAGRLGNGIRRTP